MFFYILGLLGWDGQDHGEPAAHHPGCRSNPVLCYILGWDDQDPGEPAAHHPGRCG